MIKLRLVAMKLAKAMQGIAIDDGVDMDGG